MTLNDQERVDIFKFVEQFDQGISPAAHWATLYDGSDFMFKEQGIKEILLDGAAKGWNDVAAFGWMDFGSGMQNVRWKLQPPVVITSLW